MNEGLVSPNQHGGHAGSRQEYNDGNLINTKQQNIKKKIFFFLAKRHATAGTCQSAPGAGATWAGGGGPVRRRQGQRGAQMRSFKRSPVQLMRGATTMQQAVPVAPRCIFLLCHVVFAAVSSRAQAAFCSTKGRKHTQTD